LPSPPTGRPIPLALVATGGPGLVNARRSTCLWIAALVGIWAAFFGAVVGRRYLFFGDIATNYYPFRVFLHESLRGGHLPQWNPYLFGGISQFAEGQGGTLYPLSALGALLLTPYGALTWLVAGHVLLAGVFMFLFARVRGLARSSALVAALVWMFSGFFFAHSQHWGLSAAAAYAPLLLCCLEVGVQRRQARWALAGGVVFALQILIGYPPMVYFSAVLAVLYVALRVAQQGGGASLRPAAALLAGTFALGGGLGAIQALPTLVLANESVRTGAVVPSFEYITSFSLPPRFLGLFVAPDTWGNPAFANYRGPAHYWEYCGYVGILPLLLAGYAAFKWRRNWLWVVIALVALSLALGRLNPLYRVIQFVPGANWTRVPARWLMLIVFALAMLAGAGHEALLGRMRGARTSWAWLGGCLGLAAAWVVVTFAVLPPASRYSLAARGAPLAPVSVALLVAAGAVVIAAASRGRLSSGVATGVVAALILADLLPWGATQTPTVARSFYTDVPSSARVLLADKGWFRMMTWRTTLGPEILPEWRHPERSRQMLAELPPNVPAAYGIRSLEGYSSFDPVRNLGFRQVCRLAFERNPDDTRLFDAAGVKYLVTMQRLRSRRLALIHGGRVRVYRNASALGPCWVVPQAVALPDLDQVAAFMASPAFQPARLAALEEPVGPLSAAPKAFQARARAVRLEPTRMEFEAWASDAALLVVNAAAYDPGWAATLDGKTVQVYAADQMFQAIYLPRGKHRVALRYDSVSYAIGRQVSLAAVFVVVLLILWRYRRRGAS